ncbi:MAG: YibE/F family protein [Clostridiales bacterium]|nr:YibE/F family protein [Clostridiales bacterium]
MDDMDLYLDDDSSEIMELKESIIEKARILEVKKLDDDLIENDFFIESMMVKLEILSGDYKGMEFEIIHSLTGSFGYDIIVEPGDKVLVTIEDYGDGELEVHISEYLRHTHVYIVILLFIILLILLGGFQGLKTIITLILTIFLVLKVLLPGLLAGYNPIILTLVISFIITFVTIIIIGGFNTKSYAAIMGVLGGVLVSGIIAYIAGSKAKLTGMSSEEGMMLMYIPNGVDFDFKGLLFSGIIMGTLGAVMDVGISIASAMEEIKIANPEISKKALMKAGMNVGKDIMGSMANTLILAYTGSAMPLLLLFTAYQDPWTRIINLDIIATEVIRAFAGSIGLILSIPITVLVGGMLEHKFIKEEKEVKTND